MKPPSRVSRLRSKVVMCSTAVAMALSVAVGATPATAADPLTDMETAGRTFLTEYGVDTATQDQLIADLLNGETWDSMSGAAPVSTEQLIDMGYNITVSRFADGSVEVSRAEIPAAQSSGSITTRAITGCSSRTSGSYKYVTNCTIDKWTGVIRLTFKADYTYVTPGYDYIVRVFEKSIFWAGASAITVDEFGITKKYENASGPARANLTVIGQSPSGLRVPLSDSASGLVAPIRLTSRIAP